MADRSCGVGRVALVQYKHGELDDESTQAIAYIESYELVRSGEGIEPEDDACGEREHAFETDDVREVPNLACCEHCGLSRETIQSWLNQDVPAICDSCDSQAYAIEHRGNWTFCSNCL